MSKVFLNIPDDIENIILGYESEEFLRCYRGIRHIGELTKEDFYPTFKDEAQLRARESTKNKGGLAKIAASHPNSIDDPSYYSVSLFLTRDAAEKVLWRRNKDAFPVIAVGKTCSEKGLSHLENEVHISYFLKDYESEEMNPYTDFKIEDK